MGSVILQISTRLCTQQHKFWVIQGLQEEVILGTDFLQHHNLLYDPISWTQFQNDLTLLDTGTVSTGENTTVVVLNTTIRKICVETSESSCPGPSSQCLVQVISPEHLLLLGDPFLIQPNQQGVALLPISNYARHDVTLCSEDPIVYLEIQGACSLRLYLPTNQPGLQRGASLCPFRQNSSKFHLFLSNAFSTLKSSTDTP